MSTARSMPDPDLLRAFRAAVRGKIERDLAAECAASAARRAAALPHVMAGIEEARARGLCRRAWLFGSYAWGSPGKRSDIDLLLEGCSDPFLVASLVGRRALLDVHAVCLEEAPASLRERVLAEGKGL